MKKVWAMVLLVAALALATGGSAGAQGGKPASAKVAGAGKEPVVFLASDFLNSEKWAPLREPRFARGYPGRLDNGYLINTAPPGAAPEEIKGLKDGAGLTIYGRREPLPLRFELSGTFQVDNDSAAGFVLNAGLEKDALTSHYLLLIYHGGINLWKYTFSDASKDKGDYLKLAWCDRKLQPDTDYTLKVVTGFCGQNERGHGYTISVFVNDDHALGVTDPAPFPPGTMGIWLGEGLAKVKEIKLKH